jgi:hypothetical protein
MGKTCYVNQASPSKRHEMRCWRIGAQVQRVILRGKDGRRNVILPILNVQGENSCNSIGEMKNGTDGRELLFRNSAAACVCYARGERDCAGSLLAFYRDLENRMDLNAIRRKAVLAMIRIEEADACYFHNSGRHNWNCFRYSGHGSKFGGERESPHFERVHLAGSAGP